MVVVVVVVMIMRSSLEIFFKGFVLLSFAG